MSIESDLLADLAGLQNDPLKFVLWAFPWQEPGTELEFEDGPELWQRALLARVRDGLAVRWAIQEAIASGHVIGKSACVSWLILWAISTMEDARGVVTANTETQLKTKTWAELGKWHRLFIAKSFFDLTATALISRDPAHERTWRIDMIPWSERNTEAFAGLHNRGRRVIAVFDEGSAIPDTIYEVTEGAMTDSETQLLWFVFGNPTRNTGRFKELFPGGSFAHRWNSYQVDSRSVRFSDKKKIAQWIEDYGEDSDFIRVRVLGVFPRAGTVQFIPSDLVEQAASRDVEIYLHDPLVLGVDVARFGDDDSVLYPRKGRDGRSLGYLRLRPTNNRQPWLMILAGRIAELVKEWGVDMVFVDAGGIGAGLVDRLIQLNVPCIGIEFGQKADRRLPEKDEQAKYANKRAEIWGWMKEWLKDGAIPSDPHIKAQLVGPEYGFNARDEIQLEKKEDMRKRGLASPDIPDALALTFAYPVMPRLRPGLPGVHSTPAVLHEYNPFALEAL